jgi:hypothetical protein
MSLALRPAKRVYAPPRKLVTRHPVSSSTWYADMSRECPPPTIQLFCSILSVPYVVLIPQGAQVSHNAKHGCKYTNINPHQNRILTLTASSGAHRVYARAAACRRNECVQANAEEFGCRLGEYGHPSDSRPHLRTDKYRYTRTA